MRRGTVLQGVQQEAKLLALLLLVNAQNAEHGLLHFTAVNTHGTAAHFVAVDDHIVGVCHRVFRRRFQLCRRHLFWRGERVVHRGQAAFTVIFKHREVDHPQRRPFAFVGQVQVFAKLQTQRAHRIRNHFLVVCAEEDHVAVLRAGALKDRFHDVRIQEFRHRAGDAFQTFCTLGHFNIGQTFRAVDLDEVAVVVNLLTAQGSTARNAQGSHAAFRIVSRASKDRELNGFHQVCHVHQLHRVTQVWFVRTVATLGFREGHDREIAQLNAFHVVPQATHQGFHHLTHLLSGHEGGFHIDLGKFWLTVSAQVFVAEAFHDLIVAIEAGHHQQLFEKLW